VLVVEAEEALLEDRIALVPQRDREADVLVAVAEAGEPVLTPAVGARARVVVRQVGPGGAVRAVVLAHRAPLTLAEIGPPALPVAQPSFVLAEPRELRAGADAGVRGLRRGRHCTTIPPSTRRTAPLIHLASSEARNTAARATSSISPTRP